LIIVLWLLIYFSNKIIKRNLNLKKLEKERVTF
jgi:hypothetical protein